MIPFNLRNGEGFTMTWTVDSNGNWEINNIEVRKLPNLVILDPSWTIQRIFKGIADDIFEILSGEGQI